MSLVLFLVSCGGSKKVIGSRKEPVKKETRVTRRTPRASKQVRKEVDVISSPKKNKPLANIPYKDKVNNYIYEYANIAKSEMKEYGIPASITLAQGILESGAGYGELSSKANNHFGIKCHDWTGDRVYHDDDRLQECFRKYKDPGQSFKDHSLFLKNRKRYAKLFTYKQSDYKSWAYGLKAAGYATDPKYPTKLISIIERYQLDAYDKEVLSSSRSSRRITSKPKPLVRKEVVVQKKPVRDEIKKEIPTTVVPKPKPLVKQSIPQDGKYQVQQGDTLYSISRRYSLKVDQLKEYNKLKDNTISIGQVLLLTPQVQEVQEDQEEEDEF